jgi:hypothetical protein
VTRKNAPKFNLFGGRRFVLTAKVQISQLYWRNLNGEHYAVAIAAQRQAILELSMERKQNVPKTRFLWVSAIMTFGNPAAISGV